MIISCHQIYQPLAIRGQKGAGRKIHRTQTKKKKKTIPRTGYKDLQVCYRKIITCECFHPVKAETVEKTSTKCTMVNRNGPNSKLHQLDKMTS